MALARARLYDEPETYRSESQNEGGTPQAVAYLTDALRPYLEGLGVRCRLTGILGLPTVWVPHHARREGAIMPFVTQMQKGWNCAATGSRAKGYIEGV